MATVAMPTDAQAACQRPRAPAVTIFDLIPLASGATVASIISTVNAINTSSLAQSTAFVGVPGGAKADQQGGGNWTRVVAGEVETKANTFVSGSVGGVDLGRDDCRSTTDQEFVGTQAGMDIGKLNFAGGGNIHFGITAGYFDVKTKDKTAELGQFKGETQAPFAGLYMALSSGNFSFDAQVRGDYLQMDLTDADQGMFNQNVTARTLAFLWNAAYRFDLPRQWFVETSVGGVSSRTDVDRFGVAGGINVLASVTPSLTRPGTIEIDHIDSLLGRASVRVGTTIVSDKVVLQPFATASIFHEFAGHVRTDISTLIVGFPIQAQLLTDRVGTFGHLGLGVAGTILDTGWLAYLRGDYRFGDDLEGLSFNAGLRYQFTPPKDEASLKDGGSLKDGHAEHHSGYNWSGFYAGWSSGALWGTQDWLFDGFNTTTVPKYQGYLVGGQVGYNFQHGNYVFGFEADYSASNAEGGLSCPNANFFTCTAEINSIGFFTGRLGYARDRALYYIKGGLAVADIEARSDYNLRAFDILRIPDLTFGSSTTASGWAFGAGMEFAVSDRWSVKGEWLHYDLGAEHLTVTGPSGVRVDTQGDIARVGINYHFGKH